MDSSGSCLAPLRLRTTALGRFDLKSLDRCAVLSAPSVPTPSGCKGPRPGCQGPPAARVITEAGGHVATRRRDCSPYLTKHFPSLPGLVEPVVVVPLVHDLLMRRMGTARKPCAQRHVRSTHSPCAPHGGESGLFSTPLIRVQEEGSGTAVGADARAGAAGAAASAAPSPPLLVLLAPSAFGAAAGRCAISPRRAATTSAVALPAIDVFGADA